VSSRTDTVAARSDDPPGSPDTPGGKFAELRSLLVGPEQRQLRALQTRLDDPAAQARDVSRVLPAAVELRTNDPHLKRALAPTIEDAISVSVRRNPKPLADALFPIIGPAIRKAIAATLTGMLESLNTTLEHSLSWRSLRWRLDARRTGRSFAEVVLLNTLVYRVEQVFLIHRPSGLLLQHITTRGAETQDADMVSGMLSAIRDFVQDSFSVSEEEGLQTLKVGELSVWIEQGPHALLAVVIRGTAPPALRATLQQSVEKVHAFYADVLESFDGDASKLEGARPLLEDCLRQQYRTREGGAGRSPMLRAIAAVLLLAFGVWAFFALRARSRWNGYLAALAAEPGIVLVSAGTEGGTYVVNGMRDPLARDPASLLSMHNLGPEQVVGRWQLYQALEPSLVLARAQRVLSPPATVTLRLSDGVLSASGSASAQWIDTAARLAPALPGVARFDAAPVGETAARALFAEIQAAAPLFVKGTATFTSGGEEVLREQIDRLRALDMIGRATDRRFSVELIGQADADGAPEANLPLSEQRAARVLSMLQLQRFEHVAISSVGIGSREADPAAPEIDKQRNRRVAFRVTPADGDRR
jgi:outer membrane protein OmpA-like peptidoglycan-associated protein